MTLTVDIPEKELKEMLSEAIARKLRLKVLAVSFSVSETGGRDQLQIISATASVETLRESPTRGEPNYDPQRG